MRRRYPAVLIGALLLGLAAIDPAAAQSVPMPKPPPHPKILSDAPTPPASVPTPPASVPAPQAETQPLPAPDARRGKTVTAAVAAPGSAIALDATQRGLVERVNAYLTGVQTLAGDFVQVGPDGSRTEGKFYLQKPGRVRFEYEPPSQVELIADGHSLAVRDRKLATQDLYPLSQTPLRFLLADHIDLLRDANLVGVHSDDLFVTLVIDEQHLIGGTHRLMLMFSAKDFQLRQWTVTDPQGYDTTVALYNLDATKKLDPDLFKINYERMLP